ncbi:uncharacterized protein SOCG_00705 [Schizosaccharomyces octosporus yFS286]|uniref:Fungal protein n=1 Tax=Schizosaccharomyces octosporus (strain yFS286) TaxID=483514 RepID=S9RFU1_SCHOY|nr:uncharacterized protein SOCG_00705 [Schizosaccharomyces octosporus yFS286]EPX72944.1 fungal protein [Schizosaccharomyces octosporus yFS286]
MAFRATRFAWSWSATAPRNTTIRQYIKETLEQSPQKLEKLKKALGKKGEEISQEVNEKPAEQLKNETAESVKRTAQGVKDTNYEEKTKSATQKLKEEFDERSSDVLGDARRDGTLKEKGKKGIKKE